MGKTDTALAIMREAGVLACMLLFVVTGALLMLRYANDGDALPVFGGLFAMAVGAALLLTAPGRARARAALAGEPGEEDENDAYDEALVRVRRD